jgi:hypothetical protein
MASDCLVSIDDLIHMEAEKLDPREAYSVYIWYFIHDNRESISLPEIGLINKGKNDYQYFDYWIVDKKKYFLAKIKYGI